MEEKKREKGRHTQEVKVKLGGSRTPKAGNNVLMKPCRPAKGRNNREASGFRDRVRRDGVGAISPVGGGEARLPVRKQREHRCWGCSPCLGHLNLPAPSSWFGQLWGCVMSWVHWFLAALVKAPLFEPYLHSGLRSTKGPQGFPLFQKSSPPPARGRR